MRFDKNDKSLIDPVGVRSKNIGLKAFDIDLDYEQHAFRNFVDNIWDRNHFQASFGSEV